MELKANIFSAYCVSNAFVTLLDKPKGESSEPNSQLFNQKLPNFEMLVFQTTTQ